MDDETDANAQHLVEELGLGADEHRQTDEHLLRQHRRARVVAARRVDHLQQLVGRQRPVSQQQRHRTRTEGGARYEYCSLVSVKPLANCNYCS